MRPSGATVQGPPPTQVVLSFSERVRVRPGEIRVLDASLRRVDKGEPRTIDDKTVAVDVGDLGKGSFVVAWKVVSADTHPISGAFSFVVEAPTTADEREQEQRDDGRRQPEGAHSAEPRAGEKRRMAILANDAAADGVVVEAGAQGARLLLIAGRPLGEPIVQYGPFVMNSEAQIYAAVSDYREGRLA